MEYTTKVIKCANNSEPYFTEIEAKCFEWEGIEFAWNMGAEKSFEFTHTRSGLGFNGSFETKFSDRAIRRSMKKAVKRVGSLDKFIEVMNNANSLEIVIENKKKQKEENDRKREVWKFVCKELNMTVPLCRVSLMSNNIAIDVIKLDELLKVKYSEDFTDGVSIADILTMKHGEKFCGKVKSLLT